MIGELISLILVFVPAVIFLIYKMLKGEKATTSHCIWIFTFLFYIYLVFLVTGSGTIWDIIDEGGLIPSIQSAKINLIPFTSDGFFTYIMNIIMLMPLGFLLPYIWRNYRNIYKIAIIGLLFSLVISYNLYLHFFNNYKRSLELLRTNEKLEELESSKSLYFTNFSHDLKTPLNIIYSAQQMLKLIIEKENINNTNYIKYLNIIKITLCNLF